MKTREAGRFLALFLIGGCSLFHGPSPSAVQPSDLAAALEEAGENRGELLKVLDLYRSSDEPLKLQAATFLIENMPGKCFVDYALVDTAGLELPLDVLDYPDYDSMIAELDRMEAEHGPLDFERSDRVDDLKVIQAEDLIENIDLAFRAWRERPWARQLDFEDFCAYVLPYRGSNEPIEPWRRFFFEQGSDLAERMADPTDPVEAARLLNESLMEWFTFDPRFYCHPTDQGLSEMQENRKGRCEDMTNLAIYAMRANGLGVTSDYTPYWANAGNNHAWNAILDAAGHAVMFMGCEAHPGQYRLANQPAKVYRKMFAEQEGNLVSFQREGEELPRWLEGKSYIDVTSDYVPVSDVTIELTNPVPQDPAHAYLCVFNSGEWQAIHWGEVEGDRQVVFDQMGRGIAYLPATFVEGEIVPAGPVFILEEDGGIRTLAPDPQARIDLRLISTTRREVRDSTDGTETTFLESGVTYHLAVWDGAWIPISDEVAGSGAVHFGQVPAGGLYWLTADGSRREERIFTYESGRQIWW